MERKMLFYWLAQVSGWGAYFILSVLLLYSTNELILTVNLLVYIISSIAVTIVISHSIRYLILKNDLVNGKILNLILLTLLMSLTAAVVLELFQFILTEHFVSVDFIEGINPHENRGFDWANFIFATFRSVLLFLIWVAFYMAFMFIEKARKQEILNLKWDASKNEIELKNLRAQLNPHFLFNSLNSIRALVGLDPEQAKRAITDLSILLRSSINLGKQKIVRLSEELELVKSYLELEQIRFEERLKVEYNVTPESLQCEIPPLMVQTIVENSIKHGIAQLIDGGTIKIGAILKNKTLELTILNQGTLEVSKVENGVGIANTKKRLEILFGSNGHFEISQKGDHVEAIIKITYE